VNAPEAALPAEFADLAPYTAWALPSSVERANRRFNSSPDELRNFYAAISARLEAAMALLNGLSVRDLPPPALILFQLVLSLAEVAPYVEWYDAAPRVVADDIVVKLVSAPRDGG
jgi:hypothetical protein